MVHCPLVGQFWLQIPRQGKAKTNDVDFSSLHRFTNLLDRLDVNVLMAVRMYVCLLASVSKVISCVLDFSNLVILVTLVCLVVATKGSFGCLVVMPCTLPLLLYLSFIHGKSNDDDDDDDDGSYAFERWISENMPPFYCTFITIKLIS